MASLPDSGGIIDPFDINGPDFNPDLYLNRLLKEKNLPHLMEKESNLYRQIQSLDSEMQTLVYENYNKFISATETIRRMSSNFDKIEEELESLSDNMESIIKGTGEIHGHLHGKRSTLDKLSSTHSLLQKLHFMFELSPKMHLFMERRDYNEAVKYYLKAETALEQYRHFPSISAIDDECRQLLTDLKGKLYAQFDEADASHSKISETVHLLLNLREDSFLLAQKYLSTCESRLNTNRSELDYYIKESEKILAGQTTEDAPMDVLEFVDMACNGFLSNLCSVIASFQSLFLTGTTERRDNEVDLLASFVDKAVMDFLDRIRQRVSHEKPFSCDAKFLSRSLDRFYSRLQSLKKVYPSKDFSRDGRLLIVHVVRNQCANSLEFMKKSFADQIIEIRQTIATAGLEGGQSSGSASLAAPSLPEMVSSLEGNISDNLKSVLNYLVTLRQPEVFFSREAVHELDFTRLIREEVVIAFLSHVITICEEFQKTGGSWSAPSQLILILSRVCLDLDSSLLQRLIGGVDDTLNIKSSRAGNLTPITDLTSRAKETAQNLLNHYVRREGCNISQMIRKSMETRDWMSAIEPRSVRSVMKRVIEDITLIDSNVGDLYEEGSRVERSSDSSRSRRTFSALGTSFSSRGHGGGKGHQTTSWSQSLASTSGIDQSLMSNIQKLFSEKIEVFTPVDFSKLSVLTGVIKIGLKTLLECVRLCTFSRYGLQQVQVDCFYLQMFLWKYVSDENLIHNLLDEVLTSAINRTVDPVLMEVSVVEKICEG